MDEQRIITPRSSYEAEELSSMWAGTIVGGGANSLDAYSQMYNAELVDYAAYRSCSHRTRCAPGGWFAVLVVTGFTG